MLDAYRARRAREMREQAGSIRAAFEEGDLETVIPDPEPLLGDQADNPMWETEKWW